MEAIILAGGFGTRLRPSVADLPKCMASINGRPFLEFLLDRLIHSGVEHVILSVGYMHELIIKYFKSGYQNLKISFAVENEPLGTGGGIKMAMKHAQAENVLALNGDTLFLLDLKDFWDFHVSRKSLFSLALRQVPSVSRYGSVTLNKEGLITGFTEKNALEGPGLINAGIYLISRKYFTDYQTPDVFSLEKDFIEKAYDKDYFYGFAGSGYFIDIGIPEDYDRAQTEFRHLFKS
jgi:D-glycero-alpha-D-manno-heptose 1-phosphate guanylyltransferase